MNMLLRRLLGAAIACVVATGAAAAEDAFPSRPIRLIVPFETGGTSDTTARIVAAQLDQVLGTRVVVDNRPGANGAIGTADVAKAAPDGYTLLHVTPSFVVNPYLYKQLPYDIFKNFVPVTNVGIGTGYYLVASAKLPVNSVQELIAYAKKSRNGISFASPGAGNALHLAAEMFGGQAGLQMLHVPFKGTGPALNAVAAGEVDIMVLPPTVMLPYVQSGKVKPLAFTGAKRSADFPNVPTMAEAGLPGLVITGTWLGWFAPAGTPPAVVDRIAAGVAKVLQEPKVIETLRVGGFVPDGRPPAEFAEFVKAEYQRFGEVVRRIHLEPQ